MFVIRLKSASSANYFYLQHRFLAKKSIWDANPFGFQRLGSKQKDDTTGQLKEQQQPDPEALKQVSEAQVSFLKVIHSPKNMLEKIVKLYSRTHTYICMYCM